MSIIKPENLIFFAFLLATLIFQACSQLDIVPHQTTHEDIVKDNMKDGQANHTTLFDEDRKVPTLRELVMGEDTVEEDRDYKKEYENYQGKPDQIKRRAARNAARNQLKDNKDIKGKDVHHKDNNPMNNDKSNLSVVSKNYNRKEPRLRERLVKQGILKNGKRK